MTGRLDKSVVDTSVGVIANGKANVSPECELACVRALREIMTRGRISVDHGGLIFEEYLRNLRLAGRPGVGDVFLRWVRRALDGSRPTARPSLGKLRVNRRARSGSA